MIEELKEQGVSDTLLSEVEKYKTKYPVAPEVTDRIAKPSFLYYGREVWEMAITALLSGANILLAGPKATGKNVLAANLAYLFGRPQWNVSFHINSDAQTLIGTDTLRNEDVVLRNGPILNAALYGGFGILDEINMAKNESLSVLHSCLDHRRIIDVPGYDLIRLDDATRFIGTMNYGYAGTRELNEALISRFLVIQMPKVHKNTLMNILSTEFNLTEKGMDLFVRLFLDLQEKSLNSEISSKTIDLRGLLHAIETIHRGLNVRDALQMGIVNKTFDEFEKEIVQDTVDTLFPKNIEGSELLKD